MKVHFDIFSVAGELEQIVFELPAIPAPGDIIHIPTRRLPAEWVNYVTSEMSDHYKQLMERDEERLNIERYLGFEVRSGVFWEEDEATGIFYPLVDIHPELWDDQQ